MFGATTVAPGTPPVVGPLRAARVRWSDWEGVAPITLVYADLDLMERAALTAELAAGTGDSDEDLVVQAYRRWGERCAEHLGGQFAFALWDAEHGELRAFRDTIGFRPLVWSDVPGGVVIGGDVRSILGSEEVSGDIDSDIFVASVLSMGFVLANLTGRTCYRDVRVVRPGHRLVASRTGSHQSRYFDWRDVAIESAMSATEAIATLRDLVVECVSEATPVDGRVGAHLSGALDSSAVISLVARTRAQSGSCGPLGYVWAVDPVDDDRVDAVTNAFSVERRHVPTTKWGHLAELFLDATIEPVAMVRSEFLPRRAYGQDGIDLVVSAHATDATEAVASGPMPTRRVRSAVRQLRRRRPGLAARVLVRRGPRPFAPDTPLEEIRRVALAGERPTMLRSDVLRRAALPDLPSRTDDPTESIVRSVEGVRRGRRITDWNRAGAEIGIRYRYPLLDRRLLRFWLSVPPALRAPRNGDDRWLMRTALADLVPDPARLAPKERRPVGWYDFQSDRREALAEAADHVDPDTFDPRRTDFFDMDRVIAGLAEGGRGPVIAALRWLGGTHDLETHLGT